MPDRHKVVSHAQRKILNGQFEAALAMLNGAMERCSAQRWDGKIAKYPFWQIA